MSKPTIHELEAILEGGEQDIRINPDGSVTALKPTPNKYTEQSLSEFVTDICEGEQFDPDHPDAIIISVDQLMTALKIHFIQTPQEMAVATNKDTDSLKKSLEAHVEWFENGSYGVVKLTDGPLEQLIEDVKDAIQAIQALQSNQGPIPIDGEPYGDVVKRLMKLVPKLDDYQDQKELINGAGELRHAIKNLTPVPIEDIPEEWKDGRYVDVFAKDGQRYTDTTWRHYFDGREHSGFGNTEHDWFVLDVTHAMLPPKLINPNQKPGDNQK